MTLTKLSERFDGFNAQSENQSAVVSPELKEAIDAVLPLNLAQNRNVFSMRMGRRFRIISDVKGVKCGQGRNRTADTEIFSLLLYRLSYLAKRSEPGILLKSFGESSLA